MTSSRSMLQVHQVLAAGFIVCRFHLDKKFSELGCLVFDSDDSNIAQMTITLTLTAVSSISELV